MKRSSEPTLGTDSRLAASITKAASKQSYYTIRLLADHQRVHNAYRAYAYFRWVDDWLDRKESVRAERTIFLERQKTLVNRCYRGEAMFDLLPQEMMLANLIESDHEEQSGLQAYIRNMMAVMTFDACRRGRLISQNELETYSLHLATGVTEALHYFIGHADKAPQMEARYHAVLGAHVTHMLRDTCEDIAAGYFNIPCEFLELYRLDPCDMQSSAFRSWVCKRVQLARDYFSSGKDYLAQVKSRRCQLAGFAYIARFEHVLYAIENDDYGLRTQYQDRHHLSGALNMAGAIFSMFFSPSNRGRT